MCTLSRLSPLETSTEFSVSNSPTGMHRGGSDTKADNISTPLACSRTSLVKGLTSSFSPLNDGTAERHKHQMAREKQIEFTFQVTARVCTPFSSPPWLVWLPPRWANLDRKRSSSASHCSQNCLLFCFNVSCHAQSSNRDLSHSRGYCPARVLPHSSAAGLAALPDSDRPLPLVNSAILSLTPSIIPPWRLSSTPDWALTPA